MGEVLESAFTEKLGGTVRVTAVNRDDPVRCPHTVENRFHANAAPVDAAVTDGGLTPGIEKLLVQPIRVIIGGFEAQVRYAGQAPGLVAGVIQINAIPDPATPPGAQNVILQLGESLSQTGLTAFVQ